MGCVASKTKLENLELELGVEKNDNKMAPNQQQKMERKISTEATNTKLEKQTQTCEIFNPELQDCDEVSQSLGDFMISLMGNEGLMHIADNIFRYLNMYKLAYCRLVSRTFRDYIDNQRTMLKLQIKNFERFQLISYGCRYYDDVKVWDLGSGKWSPIFNSWGKLSYGHDVFDYIYQEVKDESELRTFLGLLREIASDRCHALIENPFVYLVEHHMHEELRLMMKSPLLINPPKEYNQWVNAAHEWPSYCFVNACSIGCGDCVQPFLDHIGDKFIDVNWTRNFDDPPCMHAAFDNDIKKGASFDYRFRKRVLPLLLRNASEKGIEMNAWNGETLKDKVIEKYKWDLKQKEYGDPDICTYAFSSDEYNVFEMLGINRDDYQKLDSDEDSHSDSNSNSTSDSDSIHSESNSNSNSSTESNWDTDLSGEDTDPDA